MVGNDLSQLRGVSQTLWVPLLSRAQASQRPNTRFYDANAEVLAAQIKKLRSELQRVKPPLSHMLVARAQHYDNAALDFLRRHPTAQIVQLGCGLDSRYERLPTASRGSKSQWWHLDLPEVMALRRRYFPAEQQLPYSVSDVDWLVHLDPDQPTLLQAEGLFMYLSHQAIHRCFMAWSRYFLQAELVAECVHQGWIPLLRTPLARHIFQRAMQTHDGAIFQGGLWGPQEPEQWGNRVYYVKHWTYKEAWLPHLGCVKKAPPSLWTGHYHLGVLPC
jgi:O-methyltransferase involved in polyketide biosynthesis